MKALFLDCISGISGDMMVGALLDLGVKPSGLEWELSKLGVGDFHMHFDRAKRKEIEGVKFDIHEGSTHQEHDHDHDCGHDHGHGHEGHEHGHKHDEGHTHETPQHAHEHSHAHEPHAHDEHEHGHAHDAHECGHTHEHRHDEEHHHAHEHGHHHHGRNYREIRDLIGQSGLSDFVKKHAVGIFHRIAEAEGKIHGMSAEDVHFHEVGAFDSIADIVLTCVGIEALGIEKVFCSALHDGRGTVECAHGTFPVPAPATMEILKGIPLGQIDEPHELITPTGAAIVAEFSQGFGLMPAMKVERIGYGLGSRELANRPNVLRAVLGETA